MRNIFNWFCLLTKCLFATRIKNVIFKNFANYTCEPYSFYKLHVYWFNIVPYRTEIKTTSTNKKKTRRENCRDTCSFYTLTHTLFILLYTALCKFKILFILISSSLFHSFQYSFTDAISFYFQMLYLIYVHASLHVQCPNIQSIYYISSYSMLDDYMYNFSFSFYINIIWCDRQMTFALSNFSYFTLLLHTSYNIAY